MTPPNLVLGVALMDEDHAHLEALFERVADTADAGLPDLLATAEAETRAHFEREENLMQRAAVPVLHCHVAQHRLVLAEFASGHDAAARGDAAALRRFLGNSLPALIEAHVDSADRVTASFLRNEIAGEALSALRLPPNG